MLSTPLFKNYELVVTAKAKYWTIIMRTFIGLASFAGAEMTILMMLRDELWLLYSTTMDFVSTHFAF